jgi:hypothetical protein
MLGDGGEEPSGISSHDQALDASANSSISSSPSSPSSPSFAPRGQPKARLKLRSKIPPPLQLSIPKSHAVTTTIHKTYSVSWTWLFIILFGTDGKLQRAINSRLGQADNARFLERFRYIIVASQLLSIHSYPGQTVQALSREGNASPPIVQRRGATTLAGAFVTISCVFSLLWLVKWVVDEGVGKAHISMFLVLLLGLALLSQAYMRRQWLQYLREQALSETSEFVTKAQEFDQVASASITLVQEVELVSRGYRM